MSHIVTIETKVHDRAAVEAACRRLGLAEPVEGTANLFSGEASGLLVRLPDWEYPAVIDVVNGVIRFDIYEGAWGDRRNLDRFLQAYAVARATQEARKSGCTVTESELQDGSIKLLITEHA